MAEAAGLHRTFRTLLVVAVALPLAVYVAISWYLRGERLREGEQQVQQTVMVLEEHALRVFEAQQHIMDRIDQYVADMGWEEIRQSASLHRFLRGIAASSPHVDGLWLIPPDGRTANSADLFPFPDVDVSDREYFRAVQREDEVHFGEMIVGRTKGTLNFNLSRRRSPRAGFNGLILVTASVDYFNRFWQQVSPHENHVALLLRPDGELLARYPALESLPPRLPDDFWIVQAVRNSFSGVYTAASPIDGARRIFGYSQVGTYPLYVAFGVDEADILAPWQRDALYHGLFALSAAALLVGILLVALRQSRVLAAAMRSWRETAGQLSEEVDRRLRAEDVAAERERLLRDIREAHAERRAILDTMLEGVVAYSADGEVIYSNGASRRILRLPNDAQPLLTALAREERVRRVDRTPLAEAEAPVARLLRGETLAQEDLRIVIDGGEEVICRFTGAPLLNEDSAVSGAVLTFADVSEEWTHSERRTLLMNELDHRVRNMLATIQAMVRLSSAGAASVPALVETLGGRIGAMARTHGLLTQASWRGALLDRIVSDVVQPYASSGRLVLDGTEGVMLAPKDAIDFSLVIHELATNAAKYGAWSADRGSVEVSWAVLRGAVPHVRVLWRERGGPPVEVPERTGFGTTVIRSAFREDGTGVDLRYDAEGVTCELRVPLRSVGEAAPLTPAVPLPPAAVPGRSLDGLAILVAEDEALVAMEAEAQLQEAGAVVVGPAATVRDATRLLDEQPVAAALLDVNLNGENVGPLAELLIARDVPIVFASGYGNLELLPSALRDRPLLQKPYKPGDLVAALAAARGAGASG